MSVKSSPSPRLAPVNQVDESKLPEGHCRYLLPQPELKGQRCGCAHFTLNRNIPGATCTCGHQSCFHTHEPYSPELEYLRRRVRDLQDHVDRDHEEKMSLIARVSALEEIVEKSRDEVSLEIKGSYRNLSRAWHSIGELERQAKEYELRFRQQEEHIRGLREETRRLENRQLELNDADISLEERIESLEELEDLLPHSRPQLRNSSFSDVPPLSNTKVESSRPARASGAPLSPLTTTPTLRPLNPVPSSSDGSKLWTVHISLLPTSTLPFPFERNTNAYKRCLSRGLHRVVAINGHDAESFISAVTSAFSSVLKGRQWMPLQARLCNAQTLKGLPMLRQLDDSLVHGKYDVDFLRTHCAVLDDNGLIDSLYIAMRFDTMSWHWLRLTPVYMHGLEDCWAYDSHLDLPEDDDAIDDSERPSAGDIVPGAFSTLKRAASEMTRSASFGSATAGAAAGSTEGEGPRPKAPRIVPNIPNGRRRVETV